MTTTEHQNWLKERQKGIGGTGITTVMKVNPYQTLIDLYLGIIEGIQSSDNVAMKRGRELEFLVADKFAIQNNYQIIKPEKFIYIHPEIDYFRGSIDRFFVNGNNDRKILECKTTQRDFDNCPMNYFLQLQWYMSITGLNEGAVSILQIDDWQLDDYFYTRNDELIKEMQDAAHLFWNNHILPRIPPPADDNKDLIKLFNYHVPEKVCELNSVDYLELKEYFELNKEINEKTKIKDQMKIDIQAKITDAELLQYDGQIIAKCKTQNNSHIDTFRLKNELPNIYNEYVKQSKFPVLREKKGK